MMIFSFEFLPTKIERCVFKRVSRTSLHSDIIYIIFLFFFCEDHFFIDL